MSELKRICTNQPLTHSEARKVLKQLKINPEVCEKCDINPCVLAMYIWGKRNNEDLGERGEKWN